MNLSRTIYKDEIVFLLHKDYINDTLTKEILEHAQSENRRIALDLTYVKGIKSPLFIQALINNQFKLFNLNSEVLAYLAIVLKDGFLKTYMNFDDFKTDKRELIKRKFLIAS